MQKMLQSAAERPRMSWDEFKVKNQSGLAASSVEEMIKYRKELDKQRERVCWPNSRALLL